MLVPVVRLFLFVRDDGMQLADWLAYHAGVVGPTRIHIIDHQSKESRAREVLARARSRGAEVETFTGTFKQKAQALTKMMRRRRRSADFLVVRGRPASRSQALRLRLPAHALELCTPPRARAAARRGRIRGRVQPVARQLDL